MLFTSTKGSKCGVVVWTCSNLCAKSNCVQTLLAIIVPSDMHWFSVSWTHRLAFLLSEELVCVSKSVAGRYLAV